MANKIIQVIKRDTLAHKARQEKARPVASRRQPVSTTTNLWVGELRQRQQTEARAAYRQFFGDGAPLPNYL